MNEFLLTTICALSFGAVLINKIKLPLLVEVGLALIGFGSMGALLQRIEPGVGATIGPAVMAGIGAFLVTAGLLIRAFDNHKHHRPSQRP